MHIVHTATALHQQRASEVAREAERRRRKPALRGASEPSPSRPSALARALRRLRTAPVGARTSAA